MHAEGASHEFRPKAEQFYPKVSNYAGDVFGYVNGEVNDTNGYFEFRAWP